MRLTRYELRVGGGINVTVRDSRLRHEDTPVYDFSTSIELIALVTSPEDRVGERFALSVCGDTPARWDLSQTLADRHIRDEAGALVYRRRRGESVPVYDIPHGAGYLSKSRGQKRWTGAIWVPAETATAMLALLAPAPRRLFISLHELRVARRRWIVSLSLQTTDPDEE